MANNDASNDVNAQIDLPQQALPDSPFESNRISTGDTPEEALAKLIGNDKAKAIIEELKKEEYSVETINKKLFNISTFDQDILKLENGELPEGFVFNLGKPGDILRKCGFPADQNIELAASRLLQKADRHSYSPLAVRGLDTALQLPVAVFRYGNPEKSQNVIVSLEKDGKNFLAGIFFNQRNEGVAISSIRGLFNKNDYKWLHWIEQGKLIYADKEKIQETINQQRTNRADVEYLNLDSIQTILDSFPPVKQIFTEEYPAYLSLNNDINSEIKTDRKQESELPKNEQIGLFDDMLDHSVSAFDRDVLKLENGELPEGFVFNLGKPGNILRKCGFPADQTIELTASRLLQKADRHSYSPLDVRGLDTALQSPVAVFRYGNPEKSQNVIVSLEKDGKSFLAGVFFDHKHEGITISSIRGLFNKDNHEWLHWIEQGKLIYADKEKIQETVNQQRINRADVEYLNLDSIQTILDSFPPVKQIFTEEYPAYLSLNNDTNSEIKTDRKQESELPKNEQIGLFDDMLDHSVSAFDRDVLKLEKGELPEGFVFNLGKPGDILRKCGFPADQTIELAASRLLQKADRHSYSPLDVRGLDTALQLPVAVFRYGDPEKSQNVIVSLEKDGKNFLAGVFFDQKHRGIEVSDIRGLFNKDNHEWLHWIEQGKLIYADKEKIQETVNQQRINRAEVEYLNLDSVQTILDSFPPVKQIFTEEYPAYLSLNNDTNSEIKTDRKQESAILENGQISLFDDMLDHSVSAFDRDVLKLEKGELPEGFVFNLGKPGDILRKCGFPADQTIELAASRLLQKADRHSYSPLAVRGLDTALQSPVAVFRYGNPEKSQNVIVSLEKDGKSFLAGVFFDQKHRGIAVSDIRGLFNKNDYKWLHWIEQGKLIYADKEKIQETVNQQRTNRAEVEYLNLDSIQTILDSFPPVKQIFTKEYPAYLSLNNDTNSEIKTDRKQESELPKNEQIGLFDDMSMYHLKVDTDNAGIKPVNHQYLFSPVITGNMHDYAGVKADTINLADQKTILAAPRPAWVPEIDIKYLTHHRFIPPMQKTGNIFTISVENQEIRMTPEVFAGTIDYYIKYAKALNKKQMETKNNARIEKAKQTIESLSKIPESQRTKQQTMELRYYENILSGKIRLKETRISVLSPSKMSNKQYDLLAGSAQERWSTYREMRTELSQKISDMTFQKADFESIYTKGQLTSYGDGGIQKTLLDSHGILIKRQNGSVITEKETQEIKTAFDKFYGAFYNTQNLSREYGLKISHAGDRFMHAREAVGIFIPHYKAIGISFGKDYNPEWIAAHEYGHFLDHVAGKEHNFHFRSDQAGSLENDIAARFRSSMAKTQSSQYQNRTCECFARAFQEYTAYRMRQLPEFLSVHATQGNYVHEKKFIKEFVPMFEKLVQERHQLYKIDQKEMNVSRKNVEIDRDR